MTILINFWITEFSDDEFLIYTGSGGEVLWDMITTVPFLLILLEYPFNQIPVSWGMLVFDIIIVSLYLLFNFFIVSFHEDNRAVYEDFDWYQHPLSAFGMIFVLLGFTCITFTCLWGFTMKVKLPAYRERADQRLDFGKGSLSSSGVTSKLSPTTTFLAEKKKKARDTIDSRPSVNDSRNSSEESNPLQEGTNSLTAVDYMGYPLEPNNERRESNQNPNAVEFRKSLSPARSESKSGNLKNPNKPKPAVLTDSFSK